MSPVVEYGRCVFRKSLPDEVGVEFVPGDFPERLNVFVPHLFREHSFGGLLSALELARELTAHYPAVRFLSLAPLPAEADCFNLPDFVRGPARKAIEAASSHAGNPVPFHRRDIFLCTYWPTALAWEKTSRLMRENGLEPNPFYYFIQDWEPGFYPMGAKHMLADSTYRHTDKCFPIFNAQELATFFSKKNYRFKQGAIIKPSLNPVLRQALEAWNWTVPPKDTARTNILVYGRPEQPRNCFAVILEGIARYLAAHPEEPPETLNLASAGIPHHAIDFGRGMVLAALGKLSLADYASVLAHSHVGVSLMASPHPSYPPMEMACFGLEVVTNLHLGKNLSAGHPLIISIERPEPDAIAQALDQAVTRARNRAGQPTPATLPPSLSPAPWPQNLRNASLPRLAPGE